MLLQFENSFNEVVIKRYNAQRQPQDHIHVNFRYAPKQRVLEEIVNKNEHFKLPVIAISLGGLRRAPNRVFTKIDGSSWLNATATTSPQWQNLLQPVPVDVTVNMSFITRFQADIDQIVTNFVPYCDPYIVMSWKWPGQFPWGDHLEIRSHVKWNEDVSFEYPTDTTATQHYRCIGNTSFTIEGWLFRNDPGPSKPIYVIDTSFTALQELADYHTMHGWETEDNTFYSTDYTVISARPQFSIVSPFFGYAGQSSRYNLYGRMLDYTDELFLSAADWTMFDTTSSSALSAGVVYVEPLTGTRFETMFPPFSAIRVPTEFWNVDSDHLITLNATTQTSGFFDVIAMNAAGYGKLSEDCIRPTTNPYPISSPEHATYVEFQYPCISGIEIK